MTYVSTYDPNVPYWGTATHFRMPIAAIQEVRELISNGQRIPAIKVIRNHTRCGLAEAKATVERIEGKEPHGPKLLPLMTIKSMVIATGEGDLTVDLDGLQLMGLMQLQSLGLDECRHILKLVDSLNEWQGADNTKPRE